MAPCPLAETLLHTVWCARRRAAAAAASPRDIRSLSLSLFLAAGTLITPCVFIIRRPPYQTTTTKNLPHTPSHGSSVSHAATQVSRQADTPPDEEAAKARRRGRRLLFVDNTSSSSKRGKTSRRRGNRAHIGRRRQLQFVVVESTSPQQQQIVRRGKRRRRIRKTSRRIVIIVDEKARVFRIGILAQNASLLGAISYRQNSSNWRRIRDRLESTRTRHQWQGGGVPQQGVG